MKDSIKILFVEDVLSDAELNWRELKKAGIVFTQLLVDNREDFLEGLESFAPDIIISDYSLPRFNGMEALMIRRKLAPMTPFIIVTGSVNEEVAVECMKAGADDYIIKEHLTRLPFAVKDALEQYRLLIEKKASDLLIKENEKKIQSLYSAAPIGIGLVINGVFTEMNDTFCIMTGYNRDELLGKNSEIVYATNEDYKRVGIVKYEQIAENDVGSVETRFKCRDGRIINVILSSSPLDKSDLTKGVTFTVLDITERKLAEENLIHERRMLRTLIDNLPDVIYVKDINCRKVIANKADFLSFGFKEEADVLGKTDIELYGGQTGMRGYEDDRNVIDTGNAIVEFEEDFVDSNGVRRWLQSTKIPLHNKDGKITGLVGIGHDITERKRAEEELLQSYEEVIKAKEKAEEGDRLKTAFLHNISHEIRTPMNAIVGFSALLGESDIDSKVRNDYIEIIMQSSNYLLSIINDIVDISNIEANLVKTVKTSININTLLRSLCDRHIPKADEKKIQLIFETSVPDSDANILTDSAKLSQIINNLLNNAIKFTHIGYVKVSCVVSAKFLEFKVTDTGIGIGEEYHEKIFDRFYQIEHEVSRLYEGTGLGLAISKANVELFGGKIWLTSELGKGTSFFFTIPYEKQGL